MHSRIVTAYEASASFHLENWPHHLRSLSIPSIQLPLSAGEREALLGCYMLQAEAEDAETAPAAQNVAISEHLALVRDRIDDAIESLGGVAFVRLGSRSPKDSWLGMRHGFACYRGAGALRLLLDSPERVCDDLGAAKFANLTPSIWLRRWLQIPRWAEFRCLVKERRLIGISQYDYHGGEFPELVANAADISKRLLAYLPKAIAALHVADAVVDVAFHNGDLASPFMVEINPYGHLTDPCLFHLDNPMTGLTLDGDVFPMFRYLGDGHDYRLAKRPRTDQVASHLVSAA